MIPDSWMQELFSKVDIAAVIGEYTTLTPKGGKLWACCPFHNEKTPSFKVDTTTGLYYCFGCHKGGNALTFLKEKENISGYEALQMLAERVGMQMPDSGYSKADAERMRNFQTRLRNANRDAARFYYTTLTHGCEGLEYLHRRGLQDGIIKRFGLGFAPDKWTALCDHLRTLGYTDDELVSAGLARRTESGSVFDFFRNRVIFPIIDEKGNVIAFGGRTMGDDKPKYLNTGDTPIYNKKNNVYALNMLKKGTHSDIIIVEGYMDVISLHSVGVDNAIATLGTALTENQARLLKRRTNVIYVSYDGDSAGQNATMRGLDILASEGLEVKVIVLPDGLDPDDFAKKYGMDGYMRLKDSALPLTQFKIEHIAKGYDLSDADQRQKFAVAACSLVSRLSPVEQERYYELVSRMTGFSYETLKEQGRSEARTADERAYNRPNLRNNREKAPSFAKTDSDRAALLLASCAALSAKACDYIVKNGLDMIERDEIRLFISAANDQWQKDGKCDVSFILSGMEGDNSSIAAAVFEVNVEEPVLSAQDCIKRMRTARLHDELRALSAALDTHEITVEEYQRRYNDYLTQINNLK